MSFREKCRCGRNRCWALPKVPFRTKWNATRCPLFFCFFWSKRFSRTSFCKRNHSWENPDALGLGIVLENTMDQQTLHGEVNPFTTYWWEGDSPFQMIEITPNPNTSKKIHRDIYHFNWFSRISSINRRCLLENHPNYHHRPRIMVGTYVIIQYTNIAGWNNSGAPIFQPANGIFFPAEGPHPKR